ncbi:MAG: DHA2 family efflux MFS transporter permease subunit [Rhodospirillaceae bacterium]|nr:MAG: DHA2 family efflux MFS transporter permease subunit [Rhodospirillaceae bacterium]
MSSVSGTSSTFPNVEEAVSFKTWVGVFGATLGAFMAVLNIQITNASLHDIEGGIGTGGTNGAWVSTAHLVGEIIVIPLTDFLSRVFSLRRYLIANVALFLFFSVACGFVHNLSEMIVLRGLQGFSGGVLIPLAFTIIVTSLPKSKQPIGMAGFAISATFAPAIGPTIGGYLTDNLGWQYVFYLNLVPGAVMLGALWWALKPSAPRLDLLRHGDWTGIAALAIGLGSLQTVLEEGNQDDWFGSALIVRLSIIAAVFLALFVWIELSKPEPVVNLRLLARRNFGFGTFSNFFLGFGLYGAGYLLTQYLAQSQGYNAGQIGAVMMWTGLPQLVIIPFVPKLMGKIDSRLLVGFGLSLFAISCFMNLELSRDYAADQLLIPNITRAVGFAFILTPLSAVAMVGMERENAGAASGLFNMMRNLGGAVGTAALVTFFTKREQYHSSVINANVSLGDPATRDRIANLQRFFISHGTPDPAAAAHKAIVLIGQAIRAQANLMGFGDTFGLLGAMLTIAAISIVFLKKGPITAGAGAH